MDNGLLKNIFLKNVAFVLTVAVFASGVLILPRLVKAECLMYGVFPQGEGAPAMETGDQQQAGEWNENYYAGTAVVKCTDEVNPVKECTFKAVEEFGLKWLNNSINEIKEGIKNNKTAQAIKTGASAAAIAGCSAASLGIGTPVCAILGPAIVDGLWGAFFGSDEQKVQEVGQVKTDVRGTRTSQCIKDLTEKIVKKSLSRFKKRLMDSLVDDTVDWIRNGGKPRFIEDFGGFIRESGDAAIGDVALEVGAANLCSSAQADFLKQNLRQTVELSNTNVVPRFSDQISCTLTDVVGNVKGFYQDFRQGGFVGYQEVLNPRNNAYGLLLMTLDEAQRKKDEAEEAAKVEAVANQGYRAVKQCTSWRVVRRDNGAVIGKKLSQQDLNLPLYSNPDYQAECEKKDITLPGKSVGGLFDNVVATEISKAIDSSDLSPYAKAILDAGITRIIKGKQNAGLTGMEASRDSRGLPPKTINEAVADVRGGRADTELDNNEKAQIKRLENLAKAGEQYTKAESITKINKDTLLKEIDDLMALTTSVVGLMDNAAVNLWAGYTVGVAEAFNKLQQINANFETEINDGKTLLTLREIGDLSLWISNKSANIKTQGLLALLDGLKGLTQCEKRLQVNANGVCAKTSDDLKQMQYFLISIPSEKKELLSYIENLKRSKAKTLNAEVNQGEAIDVLSKLSDLETKLNGQKALYGDFQINTDAALKKTGLMVLMEQAQTKLGMCENNNVKPYKCEE